MKKVKEWFKEHKKEIVITTVSVAVGAVGGACLYKHSKRDVLKINEGIKDAYNLLYPALKGSYGAYMYYDYGSPKTVKDCPKLVGELIGEDFVDLNEEITGIAVFRKKK